MHQSWRHEFQPIKELGRLGVCAYFGETGFGHDLFKSLDHVGWGVVESKVRDGDISARSQRVTQDAHRAVCLVVIRGKMENGNHQNRHGAAKVEQTLDLCMIEHLFRLGDIRLDGSGIGVVSQDSQTVSHGNGINVHVNDAGSGIGLLGDLVDIAHSRNAGTEVKELVNPLLETKVDGPAQKSAVSLRSQPEIGHRRNILFSRQSVNLKIVIATQKIVVYAGRVGPVLRRVFGYPFVRGH